MKEKNSESTIYGIESKKEEISENSYDSFSLKDQIITTDTIQTKTKKSDNFQMEKLSTDYKLTVGGADGVIFQPVIDAAQKMIKAADDDEDRAYDFSDLLDSVFNYLNNRGPKSLSPQRNRRRATCKRLIEASGAFVCDAPRKYGEALRNKINNLTEEHAPANAQAKDYRNKYGYYISDENIEANSAQRRLSEIAGEKDEDDKIKDMSLYHIMKQMEGVDAFLSNKMPEYPGDGVSEALKRKYQDEITGTGIAISNIYQGIITE